MSRAYTRDLLRIATSVALVAAAGCAGDAPPSFDYPLDGELRLHHVQARGTHNSYHIAPDPFVLPDWNYTHSELGAQLDGGMRQFELDLYLRADGDGLDVFHIVNLDQGTTCERFRDCLAALEQWSGDHPAHHPIAVMIELKDPFDAAPASDVLDLLDAELRSVWPDDRLVTPALVRGDAATIRDALSAGGWPTLGELRGRALFWLLDRGDFRDLYDSGGTSLDGRPMFTNASAGSLDTPVAAITTADDPIDGAGAIAEALAANVLVRTRTDVLGDQGYSIDPARLDAALSSGAHFLSTDDESLQLPDGAPSRCNPTSAPPSCSPAALEDPAQL
jgi:hypothetical protein